MSALLAALINGGIASALMVAMIWVILRLVPRRALNAATRYAIWWAAMAVTIVLPVLFLPRHASPPSTPILIMAPQLPMQTSLSLESMPRVVPFKSQATAFRTPTFPIEFPGVPRTEWIFAAWLIMGSALLLRLTVSFVLLYRLQSRAVAAPGDLERQVDQWLGGSRRKRAVRVRASREIATPVAVGPWRPSILIPAALFEQLELVELTQIGYHEAAHFLRRDDYALLVQRLIEAMCPLHPVVRWIARRIDLEREIACDDMVISATGNPISYASCLIHIVELSGGGRSSLAAAGAAEDGSHLARRVHMLLDKTRHTGTLLLKTRLTAMLAVVAALALVAGRVSGLVAFANPLAFQAKSYTIPQATKVTFLPQQTAPPTDPTGDVTGRVVEDSSGNPLASAELRFHKMGVLELAADLETDRQGRFTMPDLPPGEYTVEAVKPNFIITTFKLQVPWHSPLIRLVRYGVIDGQALDARGKPLPGRINDHGRTTGSTRVTVLVKAPGNEELQVFRHIPVEDAGHYRVHDLPPGEYALGLWYSGLNDGSGMQLYPDNSHPQIFTVLGGEEYSNINFTVIARPAWQVSGKVVLPEGVKGQFQLALGLPDQPTLPVGMTLSEKDGSFHFEKIPPGTYDLFAAGPTGGYTAYESILGRGDPLFGRTRIQVGAQNLDNLSVSLGSGRTLKVVVRGAGSEGIPEGCPRSASVLLNSLEPWGTLFMSRGQAEFGKEQSISGLAPGRFRVDTTDLGAGCFQTKRPIVDLAADAPEPVTIELASAGSIRGSLAGGHAFAVVLLDARATDGAQARVAFPDDKGRFGFEGLPPGRYRISAQPAATASNAVARSRWVSALGGKEVDVGGGRPTEVQLSSPTPEGYRQ